MKMEFTDKKLTLNITENTTEHFGISIYAKYTPLTTYLVPLVRLEKIFILSNEILLNKNIKLSSLTTLSKLVIAE